jgi:hypothetical protein
MIFQVEYQQGKLNVITDALSLNVMKMVLKLMLYRAHPLQSTTCYVTS